MFRSFFLFFLSLISLFANAQNDTLTQKFSRAACDCFGDARTKKVLDEEAFGECIQYVMAENSDLIKQECLRVYGDTSEENAYKLGRNLFDNIKLKLIDDCYDFFFLMDSLRMSAFKGLNVDSLSKELKYFSSRNKAPDSTTFYSDRGILKLQLKDIDGAYKDLDKAVNLQRDNLPAHLFRGMALEMKKDYTGAINDFQYVADATKDPNYLVLVAIVKRKKKMGGEVKK